MSMNTRFYSYLFILFALVHKLIQTRLGTYIPLQITIFYWFLANFLLINKQNLVLKLKESEKSYLIFKSSYGFCFTQNEHEYPFSLILTYF